MSVTRTLPLLLNLVLGPMPGLVVYTQRKVQERGVLLEMIEINGSRLYKYLISNSGAIDDNQI